MGDNWGGQYSRRALNRRFKKQWPQRKNSFPDLEWAIPLASDYYAAGSHFGARAKLRLRQGNLPLCAWDVLRARSCLKRAYRLVTHLSVTILLKFWDADQLDVGASVARAWRDHVLARNFAAEGVVRCRKEPLRYAPHTLPLLLLHQAREAQREGRPVVAGNLLAEIKHHAQEVTHKGQAARIYRGLWECYKKLASVERGYRLLMLQEEMTACYVRAQQLAQEAGADQVLKLKAVR